MRFMATQFHFPCILTFLRIEFFWKSHNRSMFAVKLFRSIGKKCFCSSAVFPRLEIAFRRHSGFLPQTLLSQLSRFKRILDHFAGQIFHQNFSGNVWKLCKRVCRNGHQLIPNFLRNIRSVYVLLLLQLL